MTNKEIEIQRALGLVNDYVVMVVVSDSHSNMYITPSHVEVVRDCVDKITAEKFIRNYYSKHKLKVQIHSINEVVGRITSDTYLHTSFQWWEHKDGELVLLKDIKDEKIRKAVKARKF